MKSIYLIRGCSGSGKSTFAKTLGGLHIEADMFFVKDGEYKFDVTKLKQAHNWCHDVVENWMENSEERIVVSNTFTQEWEMKAYYELAEKYGYRVHSIIVENVHEGKNVHNVPEDKINEMKKRFIVRL
jgi:predicted kinase